MNRSIYAEYESERKGRGESMTPGLVSVVITCYQQARFLADAIESVLGQTYAQHEITVIDDGSSDSAHEVAARYPQVNYVWQENQDVSAARNTGLGYGSGEFQVFLDADDRFMPGAFERGTELLRLHPKCAFVAGCLVYISATGERIPTPEERRHVEKDHYVELLRANYIGCPATVMFRRSVFESVGGFDPNVNHAADYDLYLRLAREFPIMMHDEVVAEYRWHGANTSSRFEMMRQYTSDVLHKQLSQVKGNSRYEEACLRGIKFYDAIFESEQLVEQVRTAARARCWGSLARNAFTLLRRHPHLFAAHAGRKMRRMASDKERNTA